MPLPSYPATRLAKGVQDPAFGGAAAIDWGGPAWAFHDNAIQELERQVLQLAWSGCLVTRARVASAGLPGDWLVFVDDGAAPYTLKTIAALDAGGGTYSDTSTPRFGMLLEPCSAWAAQGDEPLIAIAGLVPPSIHGFNPGVAGYAALHPNTGRTVAQADGDTVVGRIASNGTLFLPTWPMP